MKELVFGGKIRFGGRQVMAITWCQYLCVVVVPKYRGSHNSYSYVVTVKLHVKFGSNRGPVRPHNFTLESTC